MNEPYCMLASDLDNLTFTQLIFYFKNDEEIRGVKKISQNQIRKIIEENGKVTMTRAEFLKRGEEVRKQKKEQMAKRRQERIEAAKGGKRVK